MTRYSLLKKQKEYKVDLAHLKRLEVEYHVQLPALYHQLCLDGMLNTGKYGRDWYSNHYAARLTSPTLLFLSNEFELLEDDSLLEMAEYVNIDCVPENLIGLPFAMNGAGDYYCFAYEKSALTAAPFIILLAHDYDGYCYLARSFEDFIFRHFLEALTDLSFFDLEDDRFIIEDALLTSLKAHQKYLLPAHYRCLSEILQRKRLSFEHRYGIDDRYIEELMGFLSKEEYETLLAVHIPCEHLNQAVEF